MRGCFWRGHGPPSSSPPRAGIRLAPSEKKGRPRVKPGVTITSSSPAPSWPRALACGLGGLGRSLGGLAWPSLPAWLGLHRLRRGALAAAAAPSPAWPACGFGRFLRSTGPSSAGSWPWRERLWPCAFLAAAFLALRFWAGPHGRGRSPGRGRGLLRLSRSASSCSRVAVALGHVGGREQDSRRPCPRRAGRAAGRRPSAPAGRSG